MKSCSVCHRLKTFLKLLLCHDFYRKWEVLESLLFMEANRDCQDKDSRKKVVEKARLKKRRF